MQAQNIPFHRILNGTRQFVIPVFQRDYRWETEQCDRFWRDIIAIARDEQRSGHFLGSVVYVSTEDSSAGFVRWQLIDGQQRMTTLTLLLAALRDHIQETEWRSPDGDPDAPISERIEHDFLINGYEETERRYKLKLRRYDWKELQAILDKKEVPDNLADNNQSGRIQENYQFFKQQLKDSDPAEVYRGIGRLVVVDLSVTASDNPQLIFESLNSTGVTLSQSDLIRNFVLMAVSPSEQDRLYRDYWQPTEALYRNSEKAFDTFVRDYIALKTRANKQEKASDIYQGFKQYLAGYQDDGGSLEELLGDMLRYGRYNAAFTIASYDHQWPEISKSLGRLRKLGETAALLIMRLFDLHDKEQALSMDSFNEAVRVIESYLFRRAICGLQNRDYWRIFALLAHRLDPNDPVQGVKAGLKARRSSYIYPSDDEFRRNLIVREIYRLRHRLILLEALENHGSREPTNTDDYTIEHILPQNENLPGPWREMLGENWREIQEKWVHRLGNLTLTGYNSRYSDRPFLEKKSIDGGFDESSVRLNRFVREQSQWTEKEISQRGENLAAQALEIWPQLQVEESAIEDAKRAELMERGRDRSVEAVEMNTVATALFDELRAWIKERFPLVIEQPTKREQGIGYYTPYEFLEILPRTSGLQILLVGDYGEIDDPNDIVEDASEKKYFRNAGDIEPGVFMRIKDSSDIAKAKPAIRQAYEQLDS